MTAPINIEKVFPSYELLTSGSNPDSDTSAAETEALLDPAVPAATATKAGGAVSALSVDDAGSFLTVPPPVTIAAPAGGAATAQVNSTNAITVAAVPGNGKTLTLTKGATDNVITFGDVATGGNVLTDIVGSSAVLAGTATGTIAISASPNSLLAGASITIDGVTFEEGGSNGGGTDWGRNGTNADAATALAAAIDAQANYSASSVGSDITVTYASAGDAGNVAITYSSGYTTGPAALAGGRDAAAAGDEKDDLAASIASYIRGNVADFSAESVSNVVTISYTGSNGTDPLSPAGDTATVSTNATALTGAGALSNGSVEFRQAVATAVLNLPTDASSRGTIASFVVSDGGSGYAAGDAAAVTIASPADNKNVIEQIAKIGADMASGGGSFSYVKDYIAIALEDLDVTTANLFTAAEGAEDTGDFRKLTYHYLRAIQTYLSTLEAVDTIAVDVAGSGYAIGDTVELTGGGGEGATATLVIDGGGAVTTGAITAINVTTPGSGYTSVPAAVITTSTGSTAAATVTLTANTPSKFDVTKGFLSENVLTDEVTRDYTATFTFDESGLEMSGEA
jgi:hypothetical protein